MRSHRLHRLLDHGHEEAPIAGLKLLPLDPVAQPTESVQRGLELLQRRRLALLQHQLGILARELPLSLRDPPFIKPIRRHAFSSPICLQMESAKNIWSDMDYLRGA